MTVSKTDATRWMARVGRVGVTLIIVALSVGLALGGRGILSERAAARAEPAPAGITPVTVRRIEMQDHHLITRRFSGQFEARQETALSFELSGTIAKVLVREGDQVKAGDAIARLDTRLLEADRRRLEASRDSMAAQAELARRTNERQAALRDRGFATDQTVDDTSLTLAQLESGIAETEAALSSVEINLTKAELVAPFDATVRARTLDVGAVAAPGSPVVTLTETAPPQFHVGLDPATVELLIDGVEVEILSGGLRVPARLSGLSPSLDPATRSRMAHFDIVSGPTPPDRSTGEVILRQKIAKSGAWVPLSALRQGPKGTWTLLVVREDGFVGVEVAEIVHLDGARAFVRGTIEDGMRYLPGGTHRVVPGQPVTVSEAVAWAR